MEQRSADWYRGAIESLEEVATSYPVSLMTYRQRLAAAEAREAGEKQECTVADCGWEGHDGHSPLYDPHCPHSGCPWCQGTGKIQIENTDAIKKQVASAAEVIRVAKAALMHANEYGDTAVFRLSRNKALAAIAAWEAGND